MALTREQHLAWCKERALRELDAGDMTGAVVSMVSDLGKWERPLYDTDTMEILTADGVLFRQTPDQVRNWIEGFN